MTELTIFDDIPEDDAEDDMFDLDWFDLDGDEEWVEIDDVEW